MDIDSRIKLTVEFSSSLEGLQMPILRPFHTDCIPWFFNLIMSFLSSVSAALLKILPFVLPVMWIEL